MKADCAQLARIIDQARGLESADLVIRNTRIFYLNSGEMLTGDIAICGDRIVGVGETYSGKNEIDGSDWTAVPGFIDAHVHVESSMITPFEFERCVLSHGVTTAFCDPHELANVAGAAGLDYFLECARRMIMDLHVRISSCVPSTHLETAGGRLSSETVRHYAAAPSAPGLAEFMNVPGVLHKIPEVLEKLAACTGDIDGHAPLLSGRDLNAYLAAGVRNCHECSDWNEATEKLRKGMQILIREGSVARNLDALLPLINIQNAPFLCFCTDDRNPLDIARSGHLDHMIARAIAAGADPLAVYRIACYSPAMHFGLRDRGLLAPGFRADIVLLSDLERCRVAQVIKNGRIVNDTLFETRSPAPSPVPFLHSVKRDKVSAEAFRVHSSRPETPVIGIRELSLTTDFLQCILPCENGEKQAAPKQDILKVAVLERYGKNGNIGLGFVRGFGLRCGAIATSIGHDSHNLCVVGVSDADMAAAVNALIETQGGLAVARDGKAVDVMPLPIGGLLSEKSSPEVAQELERIHQSVRLTGCPLETPFLQLAFLPLPVIPFLRITDRGVVDVEKFTLIEV